ncbi:tyrosine-type recombinase/integrase [Desulfonatronum parangueonense]
MAEKEWVKSQYRGIRFRLHPERRHGNAPDKYIMLVYKWQGKTVSESIGWISSTKINEKAASLILADLQRAQKTGEGPRTLKEKRELEDRSRQDEQIRREQEQAERLRLAEVNRLQEITFGEVWALYSDESVRSKKPRTWGREADMWVGWLEEELVRVPLIKVTPFLCQKISKKIIDSGASPRTGLYGLQVIRQVINWAKAQDPPLYHGDNPVTSTKKPKIRNERMKFLSHAEADKLLAALKEGGQDDHATYDITLLSLHCGLRFKEIATLRWVDVNLEDGSIHIRSQVAKSDKGRTVYMTSQVKSMFAGRLKCNDGSLIFPARGGGVRPQISKFFGRTVDRLGLNIGATSSTDKIVFHTCRHTCASWMVCNGVSLYQVQQILGHSDYTMTSRYAHLAPDNIKAASKVLEEVVKNFERGSSNSLSAATG